MDKVKALDELAELCAEADSMYVMLQDYEKKAKAFDAKWAEWEKANPDFFKNRTRMHPCHIIKQALETTIELQS